jgi:hypothetical protein
MEDGNIDPLIKSTTCHIIETRRLVVSNMGSFALLFAKSADEFKGVEVCGVGEI